MVIQYKPSARRRILWDNFLLDKFLHWKKDIFVPILLGWRNIRFYKDIYILFIHNWNPITAAIREALGVRKLRHDITGLENASVHALTSSLWSALHSLMSIQNVSAWPSVRWKKMCTKNQPNYKNQSRKRFSAHSDLLIMINRTHDGVNTKMFQRGLVCCRYERCFFFKKRMCTEKIRTEPNYQLQSLWNRPWKRFRACFNPT